MIKDTRVMQISMNVCQPWQRDIKEIKIVMIVTWVRNNHDSKVMLTMGAHIQALFEATSQGNMLTN